MDFQDVSNWQANKLDRTQNSRMGWSDVSLCLAGPVVEDLKTHFAQRWNLIYKEKFVSRFSKAWLHVHNLSRYNVRGNTRYSRLPESITWHHGHHHLHGAGHRIKARFRDEVQQMGEVRLDDPEPTEPIMTGSVPCQIMRSCARWSHGVRLEVCHPCAETQILSNLAHNLQHSIANAYIEVIKNSQHFVYIENQFFITGKPIPSFIEHFSTRHDSHFGRATPHQE